MAITSHTQTYVLGAGRLYFALQKDDGSYEGERYLGESSAFSVTVESERVELVSADGPTAEKIASVPGQVTRTGTLSLRDISPENLALFVGGEVESVAQEATPVAAESVGGGAALVGERIYQLGVTSANPVGARGVSAVAIKDTEETPTTYVEGTDYELDAARGRIKVIAGSSLDGVEGVVADYTPAANTRARVKTSDRVGRRGRLVFLADNSSGERKDLVAPNAELAPSGELPWKSRDTFQELPFTVEFLRGDDGTPAIFIDGEAV